MNGKKLYRRKLVGVGLSAMMLFAVTTPSSSMQNQAELRFTARMAVASAGGKPGPQNAEWESLPKKFSPKTAAQPRFTPHKKITAEKVTSFFVRPNDSSRIQLSILIVHKQEFTQAVRALFHENVTPLFLSVSTLPNRKAVFDPTRLRFEQCGRIWQPEMAGDVPEVLPLEAGEPFGGTLTDGQIHQGVILLPEWFDAQTPITVRYGDFQYLARFAEQEQ